MKPSKRSLHLALAALALAGLVAGRALWLTPMMMLWSATARADSAIPIGRPKPYQQFIQVFSCSYYCQVNFPAVTAETLISRVTCFFSVNNADGIEGAVASGGAAAVNYLPIITYSTYNGSTNYAINAQTQMFLSSGQAPNVFVQSDAGTIIINELYCSVSGYTNLQLTPAGATAPPSAGVLPLPPAALPPPPGLPMFTPVPAQ